MPAVNDRFTKRFRERELRNVPLYIKTRPVQPTVTIDLETEALSFFKKMANDDKHIQVTTDAASPGYKIISDLKVTAKRIIETDYSLVEQAVHRAFEQSGVLNNVIDQSKLQGGSVSVGALSQTDLSVHAAFSTLLAKQKTYNIQGALTSRLNAANQSNIVVHNPPKGYQIHDSYVRDMNATELAYFHLTQAIGVSADTVESFFRKIATMTAKEFTAIAALVERSEAQPAKLPPNVIKERLSLLDTEI